MSIQERKARAFGSSGCLFDPPLTCSDNSVNCINCVSKLINKDQYKHEIDENKNIDFADPQNKYHFPMIAVCDGTNGEV